MLVRADKVKIVVKYDEGLSGVKGEYFQHVYEAR